MVHPTQKHKSDSEIMVMVIECKLHEEPNVIIGSKSQAE